MLKVEAPGGAREILLHACCAPCSGAILECLRDSGIAPVVFFSNSNIYPRAEYDLRLGEMRRYAETMGVELVEDEYDHEAWLEAVRGLEREPERGARCAACFRFRLARAARYAASRGLPSSPPPSLLPAGKISTRSTKLANQFVIIFYSGHRTGGKGDCRSGGTRCCGSRVSTTRPGAAANSRNN